MCKEYINIQTGEKLDLNKIIKLPDNALLKLRPELWVEWDFEKNKNSKYDILSVSKGVEVRLWWICKECNSSYDISPELRKRGQDCPYCSGKRVNHTNSLASMRPDLINYWSEEKNGDMTPHNITPSSNKKAWWYCDVCDDYFPMVIQKKVKSGGCSICAGRFTTKKNSLGGKFPKLLKYWNYEKNKDKTPFDIARRSGKDVWWKCDKCKCDFELPPNRKDEDKSNCPYCRGFKTNDINSLAVTHPKIAEMWDYDKNGELTPYDVTKGSHKNVYWKCNICKSESNSPINSKCGCAYCEGQLPIKGKTDLWTTNPEIASILLDSEDGYKYMKSSNKKLKFKCKNCDSISNKDLNYVSQKGFNCPICNSGSFGEQVMYEVLNNANIEFYKEKTFDWSDRKRYDFYIPSYNLIIEVHGEQHFKDSFSRGLKGARTCEEEKINDLYKKRLAEENGINHYIEISFDSYNIPMVKNEIKNSGLMTILPISDDDISNFNKFNKKSLMVESWGLWNEGMKVTEISKHLGIGRSTARKYLKLGKELNKCDYDGRRVR